jgi:broad specificity phosphatase PhoE
LSSLYLIRHGQAGTRFEYDALSPAGRAQSRRLGEYLAAQKVVFGAALSGALCRQRETACEVAAAYRKAGLPFPEVAADPGWNEFDLDTVNREIAPAIAAEDPQFREQYARLTELAADRGHAVHHTWSPCDAAIVRAWIEGRYPCSSETWEGFIERVRGRIDTLPACEPGDAIAIFTSAVPIAIWVAHALGVSNGRILPLAGVMHNTALTTFRLRQEELMLFSFNTVPHLHDPGLRTFR